MLTAETTLMQSVSYRLIGRSRMTGDEGIQYFQDAESYLSGSRFENDGNPEGGRNSYRGGRNTVRVRV